MVGRMGRGRNGCILYKRDTIFTRLIKPDAFMLHAVHAFVHIQPEKWTLTNGSLNRLKRQRSCLQVGYRVSHP